MNKNDIVNLKPETPKSKQLFLLVFGAITFYFLLLKFEAVKLVLSKAINILFPFILGAAIAFVMKYPINFFETRYFSKSKNKFLKKYSGIISLLISLILLFAVLTFMFSMLIPQLIVSLKSLETQVPKFFAFLLERMESIPQLAPYSEQLKNFTSSFSTELIFEKIKEFLLTKNLSSIDPGIVQTASGIANTVFSSFTNLLIGSVFSIYVVLDRKRLKNQTLRLLYSVSNKKVGDYIVHIAKLSDYYFLSFIKGQLLDAVIIGVLTFISMLILRMPYAPMIAILVGFSDLIPIVGPLIGTAIGFIFILIDAPLSAVVFLILMIILQQIQGNIIYPKIVGDNLGIPSMWSLFATIVGGSLGGIVGMWVFIPLIAVIYTLLGEFTTYRLKNKEVKNEL